MSFGTTFADAAAEMEGEGEEREGEGILGGPSILADTSIPEQIQHEKMFEFVREAVESGRPDAQELLDGLFIEFTRGTFDPTPSQRAWLSEQARRVGAPRVMRRPAPFQHSRTSDPRVEAYATNQAHAAYRDAHAGSQHPPAMNVVITFADAARTFAYRGLNMLAEKLRTVAERIAPSR